MYQRSARHRLRENVRLESVLRRDEIIALQSVGSQPRRINEFEEVIAHLLGDVISSVFGSSFGRKALIGVLKAARWISNSPELVIRKAGVPVLDAAIDWLKGKGMNIRFSATDVVDILRWLSPSTYLTLTLDGAIGLLDDMSDKEYAEIAGKVKSRKGPPPPPPVSESLLRHLIRAELTARG